MRGSGVRVPEVAPRKIAHSEASSKFYVPRDGAAVLRGCNVKVRPRCAARNHVARPPLGENEAGPSLTLLRFQRKHHSKRRALVFRTLNDNVTIQISDDHLRDIQPEAVAVRIELAHIVRAEQTLEQSL